MLTNTMKMYAAATGDAAASIDVPEDCVIQAVKWAVECNMAADNDALRLELSFASTNGFASNDTRASIDGIRCFNNLVTSGMAFAGINTFTGGLLVPCAAGERLYLHASVTGAYAASVWIYCIGRNAARMSDRRRA